ncbi:MAG: LysR substrate-binding domain-containing protein [Microcoleaceae cyanobacterium]
MIQATLHQLRVFETVARHGSFTKAAEELMITQPTVSAQMKHLSQVIELPLFEQIGRQLYLTDAGQELLDTCRAIFDKLDLFEMKVNDWKGMKRGRLKIAVVTTAKYFIPRLLGSFCQQCPEVEIALQVVNHQDLIQRMEANLDDLYILSQLPHDPELKSEPFLDNPLVVVARHDHPLAKKAKIPIAALAEESFIMREAGSGTRQAVQKLFDKHEISARVRLELGSNEAIKQAIVGGLGISVLSRHTLAPAAENSELTTLNVQCFPIQQRWYAAHLTGKQLSVVAQTFYEYLLEESKAICPSSPSLV